MSTPRKKSSKVTTSVPLPSKAERNQKNAPISAGSTDILDALGAASQTGTVPTHAWEHPVVTVPEATGHTRRAQLELDGLRHPKDMPSDLAELGQRVGRVWENTRRVAYATLLEPMMGLLTADNTPVTVDLPDVQSMEPVYAKTLTELLAHVWGLREVYRLAVGSDPSDQVKGKSLKEATIKEIKRLRVENANLKAKAPKDSKLVELLQELNLESQYADESVSSIAEAIREVLDEDRLHDEAEGAGAGLLSYEGLESQLGQERERLRQLYELVTGQTVRVTSVDTAPMFQRTQAEIGEMKKDSGALWRGTLHQVYARFTGKQWTTPATPSEALAFFEEELDARNERGKNLQRLWEQSGEELRAYREASDALSNVYYLLVGGSASPATVAEKRKTLIDYINKAKADYETTKKEMDEYREARTRQEWRAQRGAAVDALQADAKAAVAITKDLVIKAIQERLQRLPGTAVDTVLARLLGQLE